MSNNKTLKSSSHKAIKKFVEKNLEALLIKIYPGMEQKKVRKRIKRAGKILVKGINIKEITGKEIDGLKETMPVI